MQLKLSSYSEYIHSLEQLSLAIEAINDYDSAVKMSESLFLSKKTSTRKRVL